MSALGRNPTTDYFSLHRGKKPPDWASEGYRPNAPHSNLRCCSSAQMALFRALGK